MSTQFATQPALPSPAGQLGWPQQGQWTYADYLRLPEDNRRYEIIAGVLYVANAPSVEHQFTVMKIAGQLDFFISQQQLGMVLTAPVEVHLSSTTRPVQPDILFMRRERAGGAEYWLVDPKARLVEVYILARGEYALLGQYTGDEIVTSQVLAGFQVKASTLFLPVG